MSMWDAEQAKSKGEVGAKPTCSVCGTKSVLDPCRSCADQQELALYPRLEPSK